MKPNPLTKFSLFCWNIGNPSEKRAKRQAAWLDKRPEHVFVLTETKNSNGCLFIEKYFKERNYDVFFPKPKNNEYGTMIISKYSLKTSNFSNKITHLRSRVASVKLKLSAGLLEIIGVYVPSRNSEQEKINKKGAF
jgi:exodeoxyribonuclease III